MKEFYKSKGIIGGILSSLSPMLIWCFSQNSVDNENVVISKVVLFIFTVVMSLAGLIAAYGRIKGDHKIGL